MRAAHDDQSGGDDYRWSPRRDAPVTCIACGKRVRRKGRKQKYCSRRCRQRDYWNRRALAKISAVVTHDTGRSTTSQKSSSDVNELEWQKSQGSDFGKAPLNLLGGGSRRWAGTVALNPALREKIRLAEIGDRFVRRAAPHLFGPRVVMPTW